MSHMGPAEVPADITGRRSGDYRYSHDQPGSSYSPCVSAATRRGHDHLSRRLLSSPMVIMFFHFVLYRASCRYVPVSRSTGSVLAVGEGAPGLVGQGHRDQAGL
jgi:hypothetical protein